MSNRQKMSKQVNTRKPQRDATIDPTGRATLPKPPSRNNNNLERARSSNDKVTNKKQSSRSFIEPIPKKSIKGSETSRGKERTPTRNNRPLNRTPEPHNRKSEEPTQRFTPVKMNPGIDIEKYGVHENKLSQERSKIQDLLNSLNTFTLGSAEKPGMEKYLPKEPVQKDKSYDKELAKLREQQENDRKLFDRVIKEQRDRIHQLETELMYSNNIEEKLQHENEMLINENTLLKNALERESNKFAGTIARFNGMDKDFAKLKRERDKFQEMSNRSTASLQTSLGLLKFVFSGLKEPVPIPVVEAIQPAARTSSKPFPPSKSNRKSLLELKQVLIYKLKSLSITVPTLEVSNEIRAIQSWNIEKSISTNTTDSIISPKESRHRPFSPSKIKLQQSEPNKENDTLKVPPPDPQPMPRLHLMKTESEIIGKTSASSLASELDTRRSKNFGLVADTEYISRLPQYVAKHKFKGQRENDLTFDVGTIIYIEQKRKSGWWIGIIDGKRGYIPNNYIEELKDEPITFKTKGQRYNVTT